MKRTKAEILRHLLRQHGVPQYEMAKMLGIRRQTFAQYLSNNTIKDEMWQKVLNHLGVTEEKVAKMFPPEGDDLVKKLIEENRRLQEKIIATLEKLTSVQAENAELRERLAYLDNDYEVKKKAQ